MFNKLRIHMFILPEILFIFFNKAVKAMNFFFAQAMFFRQTGYIVNIFGR